MVHLTSGERIGLLSRASISIPVLRLETLGGVVFGLPTLEVGNVAQILLCRCSGVGLMLIVVSSVPIAIRMAIIVMSISSMMKISSMVTVSVSTILAGS